MQHKDFVINDVTFIVLYLFLLFSSNKFMMSCVKLMVASLLLSIFCSSFIRGPIFIENTPPQNEAEHFSTLTCLFDHSYQQVCKAFSSVFYSTERLFSTLCCNLSSDVLMVRQQTVAQPKIV